MTIVDSLLKTKASKQLEDDVEKEMKLEDKSIAEVLDEFASESDGKPVCRNCKEDCSETCTQV